jgi:hypothetical protein
LHITASAVSHRIAGLERTLGERLFERGPRGVVLAPAGRQRPWDDIAGWFAERVLGVRSSSGTSVAAD